MEATPYDLDDQQLEEFLANRAADKCLRTNTKPQDWNLTTGDGEVIPKTDRQRRIDRRAMEIMLERPIA